MIIKTSVRIFFLMAVVSLVAGCSKIDDFLANNVTYFPQFPSDILANTYYHNGAENANEPVGWMYPKLCFYSNPDPDMNKVNWIFPNNTTHTFPGGGLVIHWVFREEINPIIWEFIKDRPGKKY